MPRPVVKPLGHLTARRPLSNTGRIAHKPADHRTSVTDSTIAIVGVGYVGLPLALALGRHYPNVVAYDVDPDRVAALSAGVDWNDPDQARLEVPAGVRFTSDVEAMRAATVYIVTVPTPIDADLRPDLSPLRAACAKISQVIGPGDLVVLESTVYPGVTEDVCGPLIAAASGLRQGVDFKLGYSPERINPGDSAHAVETVVKIVAGQDSETLERVASVYAPVVTAGLFRASSIQVAEAAKVVENVQRDLNIALMNELALIFDRMGIRTSDVIDAASTKWNFQRFTPGLVGGHCIGVDPYYLISRAEAIGYYPEVIRAARRLNNGMAPYVARRTVELLIQTGRPVKGARVGVLGVTFKENVTDCRNSQTPAILRALGEFGVTALAHDPYADCDRVRHEYGFPLQAWEDLTDLDALVLAVPHRAYMERPRESLIAGLRDGGAVIDVKSALSPGDVPPRLVYWSL
jgi:UDP-N-acetyl-D-glucosamine/UDP-N-acetyl-D-galactosamine dehydrogenase